MSERITAYILRETAKAVYVTIVNVGTSIDSCWLPKSQIEGAEIDVEEHADGSKPTRWLTGTIPGWLYAKLPHHVRTGPIPVAVSPRF